MADRLGIVTRYMQCEPAYAAIQLAEAVSARGVSVTILADGVCRREVASFWDSRVVDSRKHPFREWCRDCTQIVWLDVPSAADMRFTQSHNIETCLLVNWESLLPAHEPVVCAMDKILFPYRCAAMAVSRHWSIHPDNSILLPWDVPVPICRSQDLPRRSKTTAHFPLYDTQAHRVDGAIFQIMRAVLDAVPNVEISVACGRRWAVSARRAVKQLVRDFGKRAKLEYRPNILQRILLYAQSDITAWPAAFESFGLIGLTSLYMGTPVVAWDIRPQSEYLESWKNSVLVPCDTLENWLGVPEAVCNYSEFGESLISVLQDQALIAKMKVATSDGLHTRRKQFTAGLQRLLT